MTNESIETQNESSFAPVRKRMANAKNINETLWIVYILFGILSVAAICYLYYNVYAWDMTLVVQTFILHGLALGFCAAFFRWRERRALNCALDAHLVGKTRAGGFGSFLIVMSALGILGGSIALCTYLSANLAYVTQHNARVAQLEKEKQKSAVSPYYGQSTQTSTTNVTKNPEPIGDWIEIKPMTIDEARAYYAENSHQYYRHPDKPLDFYSTEDFRRLFKEINAWLWKKEHKFQITSVQLISKNPKVTGEYFIHLTYNRDVCGVSDRFNFYMRDMREFKTIKAGEKAYARIIIGRTNEWMIYNWANGFDKICLADEMLTKYGSWTTYIRQGSEEQNRLLKFDARMKALEAQIKKVYAAGANAVTRARVTKNEKIKDEMTTKMSNFLSEFYCKEIIDVPPEFATDFGDVEASTLQQLSKQRR